MVEGCSTNVVRPSFCCTDNFRWYCEFSCCQTILTCEFNMSKAGIWSGIWDFIYYWFSTGGRALLLLCVCVCAPEEPGHTLRPSQSLPWGLWSVAHPARHFLPLLYHSGPHTFKLTLFCYHKLTQKYNRSIVCWSTFKAAHAITSPCRRSAADRSPSQQMNSAEGRFLRLFLCCRLFLENYRRIMMPVCVSAKAKNDMT